MKKEIDSIQADLLRALQLKMEWELRYQRCLKTDDDRIPSSSIWQNWNSYDVPFLKKAWQLIETETKRICQVPLPLLAYAGEMGAYSELAASHMASHAHIVSVPQFEDVFEGVESGLYEYGIVPIENSTGGMVDVVTRLVRTYSPHIVGAILQPIHHSLLGIKGATVNEIEKVLSHPQALRQCRHFVEEKAYLSVSVSNTATAARLVSEKQNNHWAAIGSKNAASAYGLSVLKDRIEDRDNNQTRFIVISKTISNQLDVVFEKGRSVSSVAFQLSNEPGSLYTVLAAASKEKISFTRLDSVTLVPETYFFMADFSGEETSPSVQRFLAWLERETTSYTYFGTYKEILAQPEPLSPNRP